MWTLLLQCVLSGKVKIVYSSLPAEDSLDFDKLKGAVLGAYELVPEAYLSEVSPTEKARLSDFC